MFDLTTLTWEQYLHEIFLPLLFAMVFSWLVGYERQKVGKSAGISAHVIVSVAACAIAILQIQLFKYEYEMQDRAESQRLVAQVVSGVGFLGAGVILKGAGGITGLTTAATIWSCAMLGLVFGMGFWALGFTFGGFLVIFIYSRDIIRKIFRPSRSYDKDDDDDNKVVN